MSAFPSSAPSPSISNSEYYSSLPWYRRWLAMLNWRPVVDYELREIEFEKRKIDHEQRMRQLRSATEQIKKENARLAELNAKLSAISSSSATNSTPPPSTPGECET